MSLESAANIEIIFDTTKILGYYFIIFNKWITNERYDTSVCLTNVVL